jgi:hypothetical protein
MTLQKVVLIGANVKRKINNLAIQIEIYQKTGRLD